MTQPMTPREKVFVSATCGGETCHCGAPAVRKVGEEIPHDDPNPRRHNHTAYVCARHYAELMGPSGARSVGYAALASGSGDHAELVSELRGVWLKRSLQNRAADALEAIIAENAALRSERDRAEERIRDLAAMFGVCDGGRYLNDWKARCDRATEAERKLAEVGKQITMDDVRLAAGEGVLGASTVLAAVNAILRTRTSTFLSSTEAERG